MNRKQATLIACQLLALVTQLRGSEMRASLANKVEESDLVVVIKITDADRGEIHVPDDWHSAVQGFTMRADVLDRIKGSSPDNVTITAYSTSYTVQDENGLGSRSMFSTAGFSAYSIEPGKSYIAYLRKDGVGRYKLARNSNQFLEVISSDGELVNDVGQVLDQVPLAPKLRTLRALARGGRPLAIVMHPISLAVTFGGAVAALITLNRRNRRHKQSKPNEIEDAQHDAPCNGG